MIETWFSQDTQQAVKVHYLDGNLFSLDNNGNKIGVNMFTNGSPSNISGSISANVVRSDGVTVPVEGNKSNNKAWVVLPQDAYISPGVVSIVIKATDGGNITTLCVVVSNVYRTSTDAVVDPGTIIPSIQTLIAEIEYAINSIPSDYSSLSANVVSIASAVVGEFDIDSVTLTNYNIGVSNGKWVYNTSYSSYYFPKPEGATLLRIKSNATNGTPYALLSASDTHTHGDYPSYATGCERTVINAGETKDISIPDDCAYIWIANTLTNDCSPQFVGFNVDILHMSEFVDNAEPYMPSSTQIKNISDFASGKYIGSAVTGGTWTEYLVNSSGSLYTENAIDLVDYLDDSLMIEIASGDSHTGSRQFGFCDADNKITWLSQEKFLSYKTNGNVLQASVNIEDRYFFFSCSAKTLLNIYVVSEGLIIKRIYSTAYVSPTGSDTNPGNNVLPYATINKALSAGANRIMVKGGKYSQTIDMSKASHTNIEIFNVSPTLKAVFYAPDCVIATSETAVSGYTRVYSASTDKSFETNNIWIFQDGVPDTSTEISSDERMPEQRGYAYRCYDTKIQKCSATSLSDALTEIETATEYKWYIDSGTLYFSRPQSVTENNPICGGFGSSLFTNMNRKYTIRMTGIDVKYMDVHVVYTANSVLKDCSCCNVYGSTCFDMSRAVGAVFIHCEASRAFTGTNGDGFNGHSLNDGDAFAHQTTATMIDCWSHDNRDDGVSLHERSEFIVIGGLYEYNAFGGGITPANGSHCTCIGVTARKNGEGGFLYMNPTSSAEGGVGGQIKCIDCLSESNNIWSSVTSAGYKINSSGNKGIMINCKAFNEDNAYYVSDAAGAMELIDCGASGCTVVKGGETGNITVKNTTLVT